MVTLFLSLAPHTRTLLSPLRPYEPKASCPLLSLLAFVLFFPLLSFFSSFFSLSFFLFVLYFPPPPRSSLLSLMMVEVQHYFHDRILEGPKRTALQDISNITIRPSKKARVCSIALLLHFSRIYFSVT